MDVVVDSVHAVLVNPGYLGYSLCARKVWGLWCCWIEMNDLQRLVMYCEG